MRSPERPKTSIHRITPSPVPPPQSSDALAGSARVCRCVILGTPFGRFPRFTAAVSCSPLNKKAPAAMSDGGEVIHWAQPIPHGLKIGCADAFIAHIASEGQRRARRLPAGLLRISRQHVERGTPRFASAHRECTGGPDRTGLWDQRSRDREGPWPPLGSTGAP
jgi:hypothetical protein